jgi:hypothetical protein
LTLVGCSGQVKGRSPEGAFDVGEGGRIGATSSRIKNRVALKVDVERQTAADCVTLRGAPVYIVTSHALVDDGVTKVGIGTAGPAGVLEVAEVAGGCWSRGSDRRGDGICNKSTKGVYIDAVVV